MVSKNGKSGYRSFTLVGASKSSDCKTKGYGGRFINKSPGGAALKAFTELCRTKRIKGICTLYVTMKDTTKNGKQRGKMYVYQAQRKRLAQPKIRLEGTDNEFVIEYRSVAKSVKPRDTNDCNKKFTDAKQSRGRSMRRTARKKRLTANNVRQMRSKNKSATRTFNRLSSTEFYTPSSGYSSEFKTTQDNSSNSGRILNSHKKKKQQKLRRSKRLMKQKASPMLRVFNQTD